MGEYMVKKQTVFCTMVHIHKSKDLQTIYPVTRGKSILETVTTVYLTFEGIISLLDTL